MLKYVWLFLFIPISTWAMNPENTINYDISIGLTPTQGSILSGPVKTPAKFNMYSAQLLMSSSKYAPYYLGLEVNLLKNKSPFEAENFMMVWGFKTPLSSNQRWVGTSEIKMGFGFMRDKGPVYNIESYEGLAFGAAFGVRYKPLLNKSHYLGININWIKQVHGSGSGPSDIIIHQFGPKLMIGTEF